MQYMIKPNTTYLGMELFSTLGRVILAVSTDIATANVLDRDVFHIETNVVTRKSLSQGFVVHLNRLDLIK